MYPSSWHTERKLVAPRIDMLPRVGGARPASMRKSVVFLLRYRPESRRAFPEQIQR